MPSRTKQGELDTTCTQEDFWPKCGWEAPRDAVHKYRDFLSLLMQLNADSSAFCSAVLGELLSILLLLRSRGNPSSADLEELQKRELSCLKRYFEVQFLRTVGNRLVDCVHTNKY